MTRYSRCGAFLVLFCLILGACGANAKQVAATSLNVTAATANAAADHVLEALCLSELHALNHTGRIEGGHCVRTDAPRAATEAERAALALTRAHWAPVRQAYEAFAAVHDEARAAVQAQVPSQRLDAVLLRLVEAYRALRGASAPFGLVLPDLTGERL